MRHLSLHNYFLALTVRRAISSYIAQINNKNEKIIDIKLERINKNLCHADESIIVDIVHTFDKRSTSFIAKSDCFNRATS